MLDAIDQVNRKLAQLGQGVDLDLTKIVSSKVTSQLDALQKKIDAVSKATVGSAQTTRESMALESKITIDAIKRRMAEEDKANKQQAKLQAQYDKESLSRKQKAAEQESKITIDAIKQRMREQQDAEKQYYQQVRNSRLEILNLEKQLANNNLGGAQKGALEQQLAQKRQAYEEYNAAVRASVEADAKVVQRTSEAEIAQARQTDQQLEEQRR